MSELKKNIKVFVGLSGGVDSAVSAALLQSQGYDVTGVFIRIALPDYPCSAGEDKIEAQRVAAHLGIAFKSIDLSKQYADEVFAYTIAELKKGRTPNPDTLCNQKIKFGAFFEYCMQEGADLVATGHYAQVKQGHLYAGADQSKDQSYFLWMVPHKALVKTLFPIGHLQKTQVRELALKSGLPNAKRHDSQGLCFLGDISMEEMIMRELAPVEGDVLNEADNVVGRHRGSALYTMGQRHGFELFAHTPETAAHFVIAKDTAANTITVSAERFPAGVQKTEVALTDTNWIDSEDALQSDIRMPLQARFRYRQALIPAQVHAGRASNVLLGEAHYIPEGQSLVLYRGEQCLGGGIVNNSTLLAQ